MTRILLILLILICQSAGFAESDSTRMLFLGIEKDNKTDFQRKLEAKLYHSLLYVPKMQMVSKEQVFHLYEMGQVHSPLVSKEECKALCLQIPCNSVLFGKIEKYEITPKRLWYMPFWGKYHAVLEVKMYLYDDSSDEFLWADNLSAMGTSKTGYCGTGNMTRSFPLTADEKIRMQDQCILAATQEVVRKIELNLKSKYVPKGDSTEGNSFSDSTQGEDIPTTGIFSDSTKIAPPKSGAEKDSVKEKDEPAVPQAQPANPEPKKE